MRVVGWSVALVVLAACPSGTAPEAEAPPAEVALRSETWVPARASGHTGILHVDVVQVTASERREGGWTITPTLLIRHDRPTAFDGQQSTGRAVLVPVAAVTLVVGTDQVPPDVLTTNNPELPDHVFVPFDRPSQVLHRPSYTLADAELPERLAIRVVDDERTAAVVALRGGWTTPEGLPGQPLHLRDRAGRAVHTAGTVQVDGEGFALGPDDPAAVLPTGFTTAQLTANGFGPVVLTPGEGAVTAVVDPVDASATDGEDALARAISQVLPRVTGEAPIDMAVLAARLQSPEEVATWVRNELGVSPVSSLRAGPSAILRRRFAGPLERALLARDLVVAQGLDAVLMCGDLPEHEARAIYDGTLPPDPAAGALETVIAGLRPQQEALTGTLTQALSGWATRPAADRDRYRLLPEWCWTQWGVKGSELSNVLELRPPGLDHGPTPHAWRATERTGPDTWSLTTLLQGNAPSSEGWVHPRYATHSGPVGAMADGVVVLDAHRTPDGQSFQGKAQTLAGGRAGYREGSSYPITRMETVEVLLRLTDPDRVGTREQYLELWARGETPLPQAWRVVITSDTGSRSLEDVAQAYATAVATPDSGAGMIRARHALYDAVFAHLTGGMATVEPSLRITVLEDRGDSSVGWRFLVWPPPLPVSLSGPSSVEDRARMSAADAVARALVLGVEPPEAPSFWLQDTSALGRAGHLPDRVRAGIPRHLQAFDFGLTQGTTVWMNDRLSGTASWLDALPHWMPEVEPALSGVRVGDPAWPWKRWDLPVRCHEARRWAAWQGQDVPVGCALSTDAPARLPE